MNVPPIMIGASLLANVWPIDYVSAEMITRSLLRWNCANMILNGGLQMGAAAGFDDVDYDKKHTMK